MLIMTKAQVTDLFLSLTAEKCVSIDLETDGLDRIDSSVLGVAISTKSASHYVKFNDEFNRFEFWQTLYHLMQSGKIVWIMHNATFDMYFIEREFNNYLQRSLYDTMPEVWDTMAMFALLDENAIVAMVELPHAPGKHSALSLKVLSYLFLQRQQTMFPGVEEFATWNDDSQAEYASQDSRNTYDLAVKFSNALKQEGLLEYYRDRVAPMSYVTLKMEMAGMRVDIPKLLEIQNECKIKIEEYMNELQTIVPPKVSYVMKGRGKARKEVKVSKPFNPNSGLQLGEYLLSKGYRLPLTPTGRPSVDAETLEVLAKKYPNEPLFKPLLAMRQLEKMQGTYVDGCLKFSWEDSKVHPEWNYVATVTGRLSATSSEKELNHKRGPALQTIPRPDTMQEAGWPYNPREWFIADKGKVLCVADLSQAEVRMLAAVSQDEVMIEAVNSGEDVHESMASRAYHDRWLAAGDDAKAKKKVRSDSKQVTFGVGYGMGPNALAERINCTVEYAENLIKEYYETFYGVATWKEAETLFLKRNGYVKSLHGRKRRPIFMQDAPRVTAMNGTKEWYKQQMALKLWQAEYDAECAKSKFDSQNVEYREAVSRSIRQAINFKIQGSVAEFINEGMVGLVRNHFDLLAQVHDEVIVQVDDTPEARQRITLFLTQFFEREIAGVNFKIDIKFGDSWACGKE